jgi:ornithine carbamoyltransferase
MSYALMYGCAKMGMHYVAYGPKELAPDKKIIAKLNKVAKSTGAKIEVNDSPACLQAADVIYTDVWVSMGEESKMDHRVKQLSKYTVTMNTVKATKNKKVIFMHCLPAFHDFNTIMAKKAKERGLDIREVDDEVFRSEHSVVFEQSKNRMHTIKAVMVATLL